MPSRTTPKSSSDVRRSHRRVSERSVRRLFPLRAGVLDNAEDRCYGRGSCSGRSAAACRGRRSSACSARPGAPRNPRSQASRVALLAEIAVDGDTRSKPPRPAPSESSSVHCGRPPMLMPATARSQRSSPGAGHLDQLHPVPFLAFVRRRGDLDLVERQLGLDARRTIDEGSCSCGSLTLELDMQPATARAH